MSDKKSIAIRAKSKSSSESSESSINYKRQKCSKKKIAKRRKSRSDTSDSELEKKRRRKERKKAKKLQKKLEKSKKKETESTPAQAQDDCNDVPLHLMSKSKAMAPMTKEEWEKKQKVVKRVYDEETGRHRLIKGDGEVVEEIVSKERDKAINQQATKGDGDFFQKKLISNFNR